MLRTNISVFSPFCYGVNINKNLKKYDYFSKEEKKLKMSKNIELKINQLRKELRMHNYNYYVLDNATISDYEFDLKLKELEKLETENPQFFDPNSPTQRVGGEITKNFSTVTHKNRMYSLANSYSLEDLIDWENRIKKLLIMKIFHIHVN